MTPVLRQQKRQIECEGRTLSRIERETMVKLEKAAALRRRAAAIVQQATTIADLLVAFELLHSADEVREGVVRAHRAALQAIVRDGERAQAAIEALARKHRPAPRRRRRAP